MSSVCREPSPTGSAAYSGRSAAYSGRSAAVSSTVLTAVAGRGHIRSACPRRPQFQQFRFKNLHWNESWCCRPHRRHVGGRRRVVNHCAPPPPESRAGPLPGSAPPPPPPSWAGRACANGGCRGGGRPTWRPPAGGAASPRGTADGRFPGGLPCTQHRDSVWAVSGTACAVRAAAPSPITSTPDDADSMDSTMSVADFNVRDDSASRRLVIAGLFTPHTSLSLMASSSVAPYSHGPLASRRRLMKVDTASPWALLQLLNLYLATMGEIPGSKWVLRQSIISAYLFSDGFTGDSSARSTPYVSGPITVSNTARRRSSSAAGMPLAIKNCSTRST